VSGKGSAAQTSAINDRVLTGIKAISRDKSILQFTDGEGNVVKGQSPQTVDQFSQAISQEKANIYDKYNALATQAGEKGISVNARQIATELDPVIQSKSLSITNPKAVEYARDLQSRLWQEGTVDAKTAQEVIQNYNADLKSFYRNPTPGMTSQIQIDAMIANKFRESLDAGITGATGEQYQTLKNEYGSLASMEKDVARRSASVAKQSNVGFMSNISNIASGAELVRGLMTGNPIDVATGGAIKAIQLYQKYLNNPDVGIQKMFNSVDASLPTKTSLPQGQPGGELKSSSQPTTFQPKSKVGQMIQDARKSGTQGGFAKIPFSKAKPSSAEIGTLRDYTDYAHGGYKPTAEKGLQLETDAHEIMDKYGITTRSSPKATSKEIAKFLEKYNS
jgi:hypothetical protein